MSIFWLRSTGALFAVFWAVAVTLSAQAASIVVDASGDDNIGRQIAYELKEKIAASRQHKLVYSRDEAAFRIILVTVANSENVSSSNSVVLVWKNYTGVGGFDFFVTSLAGNCGRSVVGQCAANILAGVDKEITDIVSIVSSSVPK